MGEQQAWSRQSEPDNQRLVKPYVQHASVFNSAGEGEGGTGRWGGGGRVLKRTFDKEEKIVSSYMPKTTRCSIDSTSEAEANKNTSGCQWLWSVFFRDYHVNRENVSVKAAAYKSKLDSAIHIAFKIISFPM